MTVVVHPQLGLMGGETPGVFIANSVDQIHQRGQILGFLGIDQGQHRQGIHHAAALEVGLFVLVAVAVIVKAAVRRIGERGDGVPSLGLIAAQKAVAQRAVQLPFPYLRPKSGVVGLSQQISHTSNPPLWIFSIIPQAKRF